MYINFYDHESEKDIDTYLEAKSFIHFTKKLKSDALLIFSSSVYPGILISSILSNNGGKIFRVLAVVTNITSD